MSTTVGSAMRPSLFNDANENLYDPYSGLASDDVLKEIPWTEWSDTQLNAELWEEPKVKAAQSNTTKNTINIPHVTYFEDPDPPSFPFTIRDCIYSWKRPHEVFPDINLTVYEPTNFEFELFVPSPLAECDFFTYFNEVLPILQYYTLKYGFFVELETSNFVSNTQGEPWRPWHHIYALCKAGKGQIHKPLYCPSGKYVLRLFYMGSWRRLMIDDQIPCDKYGNCMLPVTQVTGELWPILLAKGLLKIDSFNTCMGTSRIDFSFLSVLTGWINIQVTAVNKTDEQLWRRFLIFTPDFEILGEGSEFKTTAPSGRDISKAGSSKKDSSKAPDKKNERQLEDFCFLLATIEGICKDVNLLKNCKIAIIMNRDSPLVKANKREATKLWKRIRWVYWASKKGIWTDELLIPPYRRLQHITFDGQLSKLLAPDPKQEALIYELPYDDQSDMDNHVSVTDNESHFEPEQWADFFQLYKRLLSLNVMMKPSFLASNFKVTCLTAAPVEMSSITSAKTTTKTAPLQQNLYFFSPLLRPNRNEPVLLFCESLAGICLCISLWVYPQNTSDYLDHCQEELFRTGHASLIVERFDWRTVQQGEILGVIRSLGNSSIFLNLRPGRHVLKLWLNSDYPYLIDVYSNVEVTMHKGPKIRFLMCNESEITLNYIANVSNAFLVLTQGFGKPGLSLALRDFYKVIKPGNDKIIGYNKKMDDFIETFLNCILLILKSIISSTDEVRVMMGALQSLFINPNIQCDLPKGDPASSIFGSSAKKVTKKIAGPVKERSLEEILNYPWTLKEIAQIIMIQRIFRGYRLRLLFKYQLPSRKEFKPYTDRLKKICDTVFLPPKRELEVGRLLRKMVMVNPDLLTTFKFHEDFSNIIAVDEFTGKIVNVEPFAWVPITRFIVACHCDESVPCAFYFSCNLEHVIIHANDNDTNEEIFRLTNCVSPHYYKSNVKGYTIFAFGWNTANIKTVNWRLEMVRMKHFQVMHLCNTMLGFPCHPYTIPTLDVFELKNFYVPNHKSALCRCSLNIQKRTLLTLRLSASYSEAEFVVTITLDKRFCSSDSETSSDKNEVVAKFYSTNGAVLLSSIVLEYFEPSPWWGESGSNGESTLYILEAFVINNSWPLTKQEWGVVEAIRVNGETWKDSTTSLQSKKGTSESRKKLTRMSKRSVQEQRAVDNPCWLLQVLNDSSGRDAGDHIIVEEDRSYTESVKAMKISWEEKNPGRWKKGRDFRYNFLYTMHLEKYRAVETIFEGEKCCNKDEEFKRDEFFKALLQRMSSFSYLTSDISPIRLHKSPRILPEMPTFELLDKYKQKARQYIPTIITECSSTLEEQVDESTKLYKNATYEADEDGKDFLIQCMHFRFIMLNHLAEESKLSNQLMEEAYEGRSKAIERMAR